MRNINIEEEIIADRVHDVWSRWMKYQFSKCIVNKDGSMTIPKELVDRWQKQIDTEYNDLPESEKLSDRVIADEYLELADTIRLNKLSERV